MGTALSERIALYEARNQLILLLGLSETNTIG